MSKSKSIIIFISDVHYCKDETESQFKEDDRNNYYQKWENCIANIEKEKNVKVKYLVISGDLVESAKKREYDVIRNILDKFCMRFKINKKNVLIIPGNHDVNRSALENYCDTNGIDDNEAHAQQKVKLNNYLEFFKSFKGKDIDLNKVILDKIEIEEEGVLLIGLNSVFYESHLKKDHVGYVDVNNLSAEIQEYTSKWKNIFVVTHHSFTVTRGRELSTLKNAELVIESLGIHGINTFIYGHHHTSESKKDIVGDDEAQLRYIEIGSLGKILKNVDGESYNNRFTIFVCNPGKFHIQDYNYTDGEWEERHSKKYVTDLPVSAESEEIEVEVEESESHELPIAQIDSDLGKNILQQSEINVYEKSNFLFEYLKKDGNYKEGHFHWKNGKKTLGWINIASFLGNIDVLSKIKESIIEIFEQSMQEVPAVVGYGMEGNIIGSALADYWVEKNVNYYFYPSVHKENEHIDLEKSLWNEYNKYTSILIICDIMFSEEYLTEIIDSNNRLNDCSIIYVLSLFSNPNLLKQDKGGIKEKEIKRFTLAKIDVPICEKYEEECLICNKNLGKVYML